MDLRFVVPAMLAGVLFLSDGLAAQSLNPDQVRWVYRTGYRPFLQAGYGIDRIDHRQFSGGFSDAGAVMFSAGFGELLPFRDRTLALDERTVYGTFAGRGLRQGGGDSAFVDPEYWKVGLAFSGGYGHAAGANLAIMPTFGSSFDLSRLTTGRPAGLSSADSAILGRYEGSIRFGHTARSELRFELSRSVGLSGSYQIAVVYPRVVFWQWVGSYGLAALGYGVLSQISAELVRSSPVLGPLVAWLLKNALAYGIYTVWRDDMHWPFTSEAPLTHQGGAVSLSVVF